MCELLSALLLWALPEGPLGELPREAQYRIARRQSALFSESGRFVANPLWGVQESPLPEASNPYGFRTKHPLPYVRRANEYVIGILGGSVASYLARYLEANGEWAQRYSRELFGGKREVVFINLASPSLKQPQSFAIATHFAPSLDAAVSLNGFNEAFVELHPDLPEEYPSLTAAFYFLAQNPSSLLPIRFWSSLVGVFSGVPEHLPALRYSSTYYLLWRALHRVGTKFYSELERRHNYGTELALPSRNKRTHADRIRTRLELLRHYTRLQSIVMKGLGKRDLHLLQPSPYLKNSKIFTAEERALWGVAPIDRESRYQRLRQTYAELGRSGVETADLTGVFMSEPRTVYIDALCHVNDRGQEIFAEAILRRLKGR